MFVRSAIGISSALDDVLAMLVDVVVVYPTASYEEVDS